MRKEKVPSFEDRRRQPAERASTKSSDATPPSRPSVEDRGARSSASPSPATSPYRRDTSSHDYHLPGVEKRRVSSSSSGSRGSSRFSPEILNSRPSSAADSRSAGLHSSKSTLSTALAAAQEMSSVNTESELIDARPLSRVLRAVASRNYSFVQGEVEDRDGSWQSTTGILAPGQNINTMTVSQASDLGLLELVRDHAATDEDLLIEDSDGTRLSPTGTLQVRWRSSPQSRPIALSFWVFPYDLTRRLVLGAPFVNKMNYHQGGATR